MKATIHLGDCIEVMRTLDAGSVQTCVTSPPYWGLRDYGTATWEGGDAACDHKVNVASRSSRPSSGLTGGKDTIDAATIRKGDCPCGAVRIDRQIGLESTPDAYIARMVAVFREVRRCLRDDGTLWLNIGDSYASTTKGSGGPSAKQESNAGSWFDSRSFQIPDGLKPKDLCMIPWRVALALQADGWWLRSVIVWAKKSPMPESVTDRPTSSWEPIFLLAKSERYFYDAEAVKEKSETTVHRKSQPTDEYAHGFTPSEVVGRPVQRGGKSLAYAYPNGIPFRNQRNVWHLGPEPYAEAHFATFPTEIPRRCILAGSKPGDTVLDPFNGSGTTGAVAVQHGRNYVGIELNPAYIELAKDRIGKARNPTTYQSNKAVDAPLFGVTP